MTRIQKMASNDFIVGIICVVIATFGLSLKAIFIKLTYQYDENIDAISILVIRMVLALPIFFAFLFYFVSNNKIQSQKTTWTDLTVIFLLGFIGFYLSAFLDFSALAYIPAGLERLILFLYPTFVVIFTFFIHPKQITRIVIIALILSYLGIIIVFSDQSIRFDEATLTGITLVFLAAIIFAAYTVASVKYIRFYGTIRFSAFAMLGATIATVIHALLINGIDVFLQSTSTYLFIIPMAILSTAMPLILIGKGVIKIGAPNASIISTFGPVITIILAYFLLNENFGFVQVIGGSLILLGVFLIVKVKQKKH